MGPDLRRRTMTGSAVQAAEFIVSSARLTELYECSALLRRTRIRAEEIVEEACALLAEAGQRGDAERVAALTDQLREARSSYSKVLSAYMTINRRINEERQEIVRAQVERDRVA